MRLLFLTPQLPYPPQQGTTIRNFNIIKHLAARHEITLLSFGTPEELENAEPLRALVKRIEIAPYPIRTMPQRALTTLLSPRPDMALRLGSAEMQAKTTAILHNETFDVIQIEGIEMAEFWMTAISNLPISNLPISNLSIPNLSISIPPPPASVFDEHNAEYVLQHSAFESDARKVTRWLAALYSLIQWKKLERYERAVCRRADYIAACSETDAIAIRALLTPGENQTEISTVGVIPNGVDTEYFVPSDEVCAKPLAELSMVFAGKMDFRPNVDAVLWFCDEILARIRAEIPLAHIAIVGFKPTPRVAALNKRQGIEVTGWVPDTRPYVADAAVYVVPLRMGSGTRLKVLEAMAMGKAIVSTSRGVEGINLQPGRDALVADTPDAFAREVIALLQDPARRRALGKAARILVETTYDWRKIVPKFEQVYSDIARGSTRTNAD